MGDPFVQKPESGAAKAKSEPEAKTEPEPMDQESEEKAQRKKEARCLWLLHSPQCHVRNLLTLSLSLSLSLSHLPQAQEEKDKGNAAYKKKEFATALAHYDRAFELDPDNIACLTNKAGG